MFICISSKYTVIIYYWSTIKINVFMALEWDLKQGFFQHISFNPDPNPDENMIKQCDLEKKEVFNTKHLVNTLLTLNTSR